MPGTTAALARLATRPRSRNLPHHECFDFCQGLQAPPLSGGSTTNQRPCPRSRCRKRCASSSSGRAMRGSMPRWNFTARASSCIVLDANEPGFGGSTRNGGMVSGGVNVGKRYMAKAMTDEEAAPYLNDAADAFSHVEDLIAREKIDCGWTKAGYFVGAWCKSHYDGMAHKVELLNRDGPLRGLSRAAGTADARRSAPTIIAAAWWWGARRICTPPCSSRACSTSASSAASPSPRRRRQPSSPRRARAGGWKRRAAPSRRATSSSPPTAIRAT